MASPFPEHPLPGDDSRLYRIGVMLINGWGYNWYRIDNHIRADDLLIRERASGHLGDVVARLRDLEARYRRKYLPPPSREHPFPEPEHVAAARQFREVESRITEIDTRVRGAPVPPNDKISQRHRDELDTLIRLGQCDAMLIGVTKELADFVNELPPDAPIDAAAERQIDEHLAGLGTILTRRGDILAAL